MPLDAAVYVSGANAIFGVRGGYIYKFNSTTGALISLARFSRHHQGKSCICYVPLDSLGPCLYCGNWHDPGCWSAATATRYENLRVFRVSPLDALTLLGTHDLHGAGPTLTYNQFWSGVHEIAYDSGQVYLIATDGSDARLVRINPATYPAGGSWNSGSALAYDGYHINNIVPLAGSVWVSRPFYDQVRQHNATTCLVTGTTVSTGPPSQMGFCYAAGYFWCGYYIQTIAKADAGGGGLATVNVEVSNAAVHRVRYDATNNRIFTANTFANSVSWFNPSSHPPVYYKTGFDYPVDIVFTGTKAFAVQAGSTALKEIDVTAPTGTV